MESNIDQQTEVLSFFLKEGQSDKIIELLKIWGFSEGNQAKIDLMNQLLAEIEPAERVEQKYHEQWVILKKIVFQEEPGLMKYLSADENLIDTKELVKFVLHLAHKRDETRYGIDDLIYVYRRRNFFLGKNTTEMFSELISNYLYNGVGLFVRDFHEMKNIGELASFLFGGEIVCSSIRRDVWWRFNGTRWVPLPHPGLQERQELFQELSEELSNLFMYEAKSLIDQALKMSSKGARKVLISRASDLLDYAYKLTDQDFRKSFLHELAEFFYDEDFESELDVIHPHLIGFNNGVYDLKRQAFRPTLPNDMISKTVGYDFEELDSNDPLLEAADRVIDQMTGGGYRNLAQFLEARPDGVLRTWTGDGATGKSTYARLASDIYGEYFHVLSESDITHPSGGGRASPGLSRIQGARLINVSVYTNQGLNEGLIKNLITQTKFMTRRLYEAPHEIQSTGKLVITCLEQPQISSSLKARTKNEIMFERPIRNLTDFSRPFMGLRMAFMTRILQAYRTQSA